jgi:hypothetical protein
VGIIRGAPITQQGVGTANTSIVFHAGRVLALHEGDLPYQVGALAALLWVAATTSACVLVGLFSCLLWTERRHHGVAPC